MLGISYKLLVNKSSRWVVCSRSVGEALSGSPLAFNGYRDAH